MKWTHESGDDVLHTKVGVQRKSLFRLSDASVTRFCFIFLTNDCYRCIDISESNFLTLNGREKNEFRDSLYPFFIPHAKLWCSIEICHNGCMNYCIGEGNICRIVAFVCGQEVLLVGREPAAVRTQGWLLAGIPWRPPTKVTLARSFTRHKYLDKWYREERAADEIKMIPSISRESKWMGEVQ